MFDSYTYYAFISYSHKDEKWAKWIQGALENYRLPAAVRKEAGKTLPQRISPVFRDATDLGAGKLADNLRQELEQSRFLIVVCSPHSAKPNEEGRHWVNEEVERFCELGRADRVIPVIVDGTKETAYCPKLAEINNIGPDATKQSRDRVLNNLVAKILGLRPDELWRREERRLRARRRWRIFAASVAASFVALGGYIWWDCTRTVTRAFADYVDSYGLPEGIFPLTPEQVARRHIHYRFEFKGYRCEWFGKSIHADSAAPSFLRALGFRRILRKVVQANSYGVPREVNFEDLKNRPVIIDFSRENDYRKDGSIQYFRLPRFGDKAEQLFSFEAKHGRPNEILTRKEAGDSSSLFSYVQGAMTRHNEVFEPVPGIASSTMTRIAKFKIIRNKAGRAMETRFLAEDGSPASDVDGIFGIDNSLDGLGRVVEESYLSRKEDGTFFVRENRIGVARKRYLYAGMSLKSIEFFDSADNRAIDESGVSAILFNVDELGNISSEFHFDESGNHAYNRMGIATLSFFYDDSGNMESMEHRDVSGSVVCNAEGIARVESKFDKIGNEVELAYFDDRGMPVVSKQGFSVIRLVRDENGRITRMSSFDGKGNPVPGPHGQFSRADEYDHNGRVVKMTYRDVSGRPMCGLEGFATMTFAYDESGNLERTAFFDNNGEPAMNKDGVHMVRFEWDEFGHGQKGHAYFATNGLPTFSREGWHRVSYETRHGRVASETYFSTNGLQTLNSRGFSRVTHKFDRMGNVTNETYWAPDNTMTCCKDGPAGWSAEYDDRGNGIFVSGFAPDGSPAANFQGVAFIRRIFDKRGRMIEEIGLDEKGRITKNSGGFSKRRLDYDNFDRIVKETLFDENDKEVCANGEACQTRYTFDRLGRNVVKAWTTEDGNLANNHNGIAEIQWEYDPLGRPVKTLYLDKNKKPVPGEDGVPEVVRSFDSVGHLARIEFRNGYGIKIPDSNGVASQEMKWDSAGNNTQTTFFGPTEGRVLGPHGFAEIRKEYDMRGNPVREWFYGPGGERINGPWGVGEIRYAYDFRGNRIWQGFFDSEGNPMDGTEGFSVIQCEYDNGNRLILRTISGATPLSESLLHISKKRQSIYDAKGYLVREVNLSGDGVPACGFEGWAERRIENSLSGQPLRERFFDENGKQIACADGTMEIQVEYWCNVGGKVKKVEHRAMNSGQGLLGLPELSIIRREFSPIGEVESETGLKADGTPFEDLPNVEVFVANTIQLGSQAQHCGVRHGDLFFACGNKDLGSAVPLLFSSNQLGEKTLEERDRFLNTLNELLNANGSTIVFARLEGGSARFFEVEFPIGDAINANKEILVYTTKIPYFPFWSLMTLYRRIAPTVAICGQIVEGGHAEAAGVRDGDIILRYGDYVLSPKTQTTQLKKAIELMHDKEKNLVVARKTNGKWESVRFSLPSGQMGIRINDGLLLKSDFPALFALVDAP